MKIVNTFGELLDTLGLKPGDTIEFTGSQHYRDYDLEIDFIPQDKAELQAIIATASEENLKKMGVCIWRTYESDQEEAKDLAQRKITPIKINGEVPLLPDQVHYLFPGEWYDSIPDGFPIVDIFGVHEKFIKGETDSGIRFGCLCFGFLRDEQPETIPVNNLEELNTKTTE